MARNLHAAPDLAECALSIEQKSASFDATNDLPVHILVLHDAERLADSLGSVCHQRETELKLVDELLVGAEAVSGNPKNLGVGRQELAMQSGEVLAFDRTSWSVVFGVKVDHQLVAHKVLEAGLSASGFDV